MGVVPDHVPGVAVSTDPTTLDPDGAGGAVSAGGVSAAAGPATTPSTVAVNRTRSSAGRRMAREPRTSDRLNAMHDCANTNVSSHADRATARPPPQHGR